MNNRQLRVGMIGYGFMGKAHSHAYRDVPLFFPESTARPVLQTIAGRNEDQVRKAAAQFGFNAIETDWRKLIERDDIDLVDISTPNNTHAEMAIAALKAGKHVLCEKPLAMDLEEAKAMFDAAKSAGTVHMVSHNYRFAPAVQFAKKLIAEGRLGRIYHIRAQYLQDWIMDPEFPLVWRLRKEVTGSGAHGDIAAHIIDLARFLVGELESVVGEMKTFITKRPLPDDTAAMGEVDVDDASAFLARFENGAMGVFEATRFAAGNRNGNRFEINGEHGSVRWDLEHMNTLQVYLSDDPDGLQGFRSIHCTEPAHPYAGAYWPPGHNLGYADTFTNLVKNFTDGIVNGTRATPDFEDGLRNQAVLAAVEQSAETKRWVTVTDILEGR